jgi:hypothetical protein
MVLTCLSTIALAGFGFGDGFVAGGANLGTAAGTSWFRRLLPGSQLPAPLQIFLLYPNYRGMMFSDQSYARVAIDVTPPARATMAQLNVVLDVTDLGGKVLLTKLILPPASGSTVASMDMGSLPLGKYLLHGYLKGLGDQPIFASSSYTIGKVGSETRASMKIWVDSQNVIHLAGRERFVIGLYDATGEALDADYYAPRLKAIAKAPINLIINYFLATGRADVIYPYTKAMAPLGMFYLATVNAFFPNSPAYPAWARADNIGPDRVIAQYCEGLAGDLRVAGYYTCDECMSESQPRAFHQYGLIKEHDRASIAFAVENNSDELRSWRDSVDVLGVDPYVLGTRHAESYVGDLTRNAIGAVHGARPVWTVIQYFRLNELSHFPTEQELHDMSWMAITEGARGLFYWSYGVRGLDSSKQDPVVRQQRYDELVNVTRGISALEPVLLAPDRPVLSANSAQGIVITKAKDLEDGSRYLISYNHSGDRVDASFALRRPAHSVFVYGENRSVAVYQGGSRFRDTYAPFQAHVYKVN